MTRISFLSPTGHLGFTPIEAESFWNGVEEEPDFICADSGSCDIGPYPLGSNEAVSPEPWQRHDLELMLTAARELDVPMVIGSASDTGTDAGVDRFARLIREIADEHDLEPFDLATIYSDVASETLLERVRNGEHIDGLNDREALDETTVEATDNIVAPMGAEPIVEALDDGADVVIAGRSVDAAIFAAPALWSGIPADIAYFTGKVLECASFVAEPFAGKESVLGTVTEDDVVVEAMSDYQRTTPESVASHAMYERSDPFVEQLPGGAIQMEGCEYEAIDDTRTRVSGSTFDRDEEYTLKLEGAGKVGERCFMIVGIRDPYLVDNLDTVVEWSREKVAERFDEGEYELHYHIYGKNGVMGDLEPETEIRSNEVGVVVEGLAPTREMAEELTNLAGRNFMYARLPDVKGTAGAASFISDEVLNAHPGYEWTINHVLTVDDPLELHEIEYSTVGSQSVEVSD